jgi:GPI ethanolamine phosphate transferase 2/3 subunit F
MRFRAMTTLTRTPIPLGRPSLLLPHLTLRQMATQKLKVANKPSRQPSDSAPPQLSRETAHATSPPIPFFPYARYISIVGVHTSLLAFTALILPRSAFADLSSPSAARLKPKRDPMLVIAESPVRSLAWMCLGCFVLQLWWAGWVRDWRLDASVAPVPQAEDGTPLESEAQKAERRIRQKEWDSQKANASFSTTF